MKLSSSIARNPVYAARPRGRIRLAAAAVAGTAALAVGVCGCSSSAGTPATGASMTPSKTAPATPAAPATSPLTGESGTAGHVLAVKIDNVGSARFQHAGLNSADLVYVIQVEGGLSRYLAVYDSEHAPDQVGPVRSARQTDIPLLAPFGRVGLAYSGAISGLLPDLAHANLQNITPNNTRLFSNGGSSPTYINPHEVFATFPDLAQAKDVGFRFGAEPAGGASAASATAKMPAASFAFTASGAQWLVSVDGSPANTAGQGRVSADNVIIQHVQVVQGKYTDHNAGHADNEVFSQTTGSGAADYYRDGKVWHGKWSKATDTSPTDYTLANGAPMQLTPGRTWIVLEG